MLPDVALARCSIAPPAALGQKGRKDVRGAV
jgi:hypothetical protein